MINIDELDEKFSIEGEVGFAELENDLVFVTVSNKYADADICLYGAHVTSFRPQNSIDVLWMSPDSNFEIGTPIRGGIPVCFPWFGPHKTDPEKPMHGFGRLMYWEVSETATLPGGETKICLKLESSDETKKYWDYDFIAVITIVVGKTLTTSLNVTNTSAEAFEFSCALHSYYNLSAIENITIEGLQGITYFNQLNGEREIQEDEFLQIQEATTRHYLNTETPVIISDPIFRRRIMADKFGSKVTTVWNPGEETCSKIGDLPDDAWETFVCVEATNAFDYPVTLAPQQSHETTAMIGLEE